MCRVSRSIALLCKQTVYLTQLAIDEQPEVVHPVPQPPLRLNPRHVPLPTSRPASTIGVPTNKPRRVAIEERVDAIDSDGYG